MMRVERTFVGLDGRVRKVGAADLDEAGSSGGLSSCLCMGLGHWARGGG